ncbi:MAG: hypothetical protein QOI66_1579 [Myxococcales bacterium]|nr:hypothetical protein [Myxococcales bacterium]
MIGGSRGFQTAIAYLGLAVLTGCGQGIFTRSRSAAGWDAGAPDRGGPAVDVSPEAAPPADGGSNGSDGAVGQDVSAVGDALTVSSLDIKAGTDGVLQLDQGTVTIRSMSFDQDVVLTMEIADVTMLGRIDKAYRVSLQPVGAHSRNAIRLAVTLDAASDAVHDQFKLAIYQARVPVGLWTAALGQQYDPVSHTVWADVSGLDKEPVTFALLRTCTTDLNCNPRQNCTSDLCQ